MPRANVFGSFVQALFFSGTVGVPKYFLNHYSELEISHIEALLIIQIMGEIESNPYPSSQLLAQRMNLEVTRVEEMIAHLIARNYLSLEQQWDSAAGKSTLGYSFVGLIDELSERWAIEQVKRYEAEQSQQKERLGQQESLSSPNTTIGQIIKTFEQELGRPLTSIECEVIETWIASKFSEELILAAFKRGVLAGIRNFRYIDSILREWEKKGLRTLHEVEADDAYFQAKHEKSRGKKTPQQQPARKVSPGKYEDFYLS
ncbi:DnaD domain-containing protein [Desulfitobacterium chlororespirans]|uniref:DNA replication protein DnaD /DnaD domain protein n=1 Tax=Desulfitobacterium chlororespirans DSM 11544 TaxID=1121395 RepID=A0A1M7UMV0_9FIRM|nr:DnaD domain protein [Desulfitobacterium chlororespirans]SHN84341.1 DNA replication protein DnaD /DnaD domain protein [Desulfitobacterium chlororespirans DSM 11544]